ncbi:MAG: ankyrin repeat domain-containing protein [Deltaproteobacteria bacterium]|jgi:ankyrin repeat protein|nr:ankyrin repeat domain-containing protein [Deltaproteobacteria bacterium]
MADKKIQGALFDAIVTKKIDEVRKALELKPNLNAVAGGVFFPLHLAAKKGKPEIVALLIEAGAKTNSLVGMSALDGAAEKADVETLKLLLKNGAPVIHKDWKKGRTPLDAAVLGKDPDCVKLILQAGIDIKLKGLVALHFASKQGALEIIELLLAAGMDINGTDIGKHTPFAEERTPATPLYYAVQENQLEAARLLLEKGADPFGGHPTMKQMLQLAKKEMVGLLKQWAEKNQSPSPRISSGVKKTKANSSGALPVDSEDLKWMVKSYEGSFFDGCWYQDKKISSAFLKWASECYPEHFPSAQSPSEVMTILSDEIGPDFLEEFLNSLSEKEATRSILLVAKDLTKFEKKVAAKARKILETL